MTMAMSCPHCSADAAPGFAFCGSCGLALPSAVATGPRVVDGRGGGTTPAAMKLRADELLATAKRAARSLLSVGIVNLAFAGFYAYLFAQQPRLLQVPFVVALATGMAVAGAIYVGLYFWANVHPLSATITGLVVYVAKWGVDIAIRQVLMPAQSQGNAASNYSFVRILMVVYLVRGIVAAVRHRELERQQSAGAAPLPVIA